MFLWDLVLIRVIAGPEQPQILLIARVGQPQHLIVRMPALLLGLLALLALLHQLQLAVPEHSREHSSVQRWIWAP